MNNIRDAGNIPTAPKRPDISASGGIPGPARGSISTPQGIAGQQPLKNVSEDRLKPSVDGLNKDDGNRVSDARDSIQPVQTRPTDQNGAPATFKDQNNIPTGGAKTSADIPKVKEPDI